MGNIKVDGNQNTFEKVKIGGNKTKISISIGTVVIIFFVIAFFYYSSNQNDKNIIGTWQSVEGEKQYEFTSDGSVIYLNESSEGFSATYSVDEDKIYFNLKYLWANATITADIKISGNKLTLSNFANPEKLFGVSKDTVITYTRID